MRILIYTGKGGVGKTSIAAATAVHLAEKGKKVLIMSTDQAHSLGDAFEKELSGQAQHVMDHLDALEIDPVEESRKAWGNLRDYLKEIISNKSNNGIEADEVLLFPGMDELFSLLRILDVYQEGKYDVILVDCAPTGETLSLLSYPEQLGNIADKLLPMVRGMNSALGSLISRRTSVPKPRDQVFEEFDKLVKRLTGLQEIMRDRKTTSMRIVMTPERIVLNEARRSYTWIQGYDFNVDAVYVNRIYPQQALDGYFAGWQDQQQKGLKLAEESFAQQKIFYLLLQEEELRGIAALEKASALLYAEEEPDQIFCQEQAFHIEEAHGTRTLVMHLPFAEQKDLNVQKEEEDLILTIRNERRRFRLPDNLCRRKMSGWSYADGQLRVDFDY